jgi:hypothetical protein
LLLWYFAIGASVLHAQNEIEFEAKGWYAFWSANPSDVSTSTSKGIGEADITPAFMSGPAIVLRFKNIIIESTLLFGNFTFDYGDYRHYFYDKEGTSLVWVIDDFIISGRRLDFSLLLGYPFTKTMTFYTGYRGISLNQEKEVPYSELFWNGETWEYIQDGEDVYSYSDTKSYFGIGMSLEFPLTKSGLFLPVRLVYFTNKLQGGVEIWDIGCELEWRSRSPFTLRGGYRACLRGNQNIEEIFHGLQIGIQYSIVKKNRGR